MLSKEDFVVRPVHDLGFKALFGHPSDPDCLLLKDFLKTLFHKDFDLLEFKDREITPEQLNCKTIRLDLRIVCDHVFYNLEMQMIPQYYEGDRALFYLSAALQDQVTKGKQYYELEPVEQVFLMAENSESFPLPFEHFGMLSYIRHTPLTPAARITMISLKRIVSEIKDYAQMNDLQKWAVFFLHAHEEDHEGMKELLKEDKFRKGHEIMKMINNDEELRNGAFQRRKDEMDANARIHWVKQHALKEGMEKGTHLTKTRTAFNLMKLGLDDFSISKAVELSLYEVDELRHQFNVEHMYVAETQLPYGNKLQHQKD